MAKKIAWTEQARADVRAIDRKTAIDLLHRLAGFLETEDGDVRRLTDIDPPELRLRIGDYRVRYYDQGDSIEILRVRNRKEALPIGRKPALHRMQARAQTPGMHKQRKDRSMPLRVKLRGMFTR